ncbi:hypothetical protein M569_09779 [Genlisea aurea]|uniref:Uncharacterized protein n=1 Tax=Genlisea aurea TaxID=192259 RepID=S8CDR7_9LAMI|nr:hypothetical protein M569_09779 [Genlisea aurea]
MGNELLNIIVYQVDEHRGKINAAENVDQPDEISFVGISISTKAMEYYHSGDGSVIHFADFIEELKSYLKVYGVLCVGDEDGVLSLKMLCLVWLYYRNNKEEKEEEEEE